MALVRLVDKIPVGSSFVVFQFDCPAEFTAFPGHFVQVQATIDGESFGRHYSVSSPFVCDTFDITVAVDQDGTVSPWLAQREVGDRVEIEGPFGQNYYEGGIPVVVIASGPGIGAALGIAERAAANETEFSVLYSNPILAFERHLSRLATTNNPVIYVKNQLADGIELVLDNGELFVFGFRDFIASVESVLKEHGVDVDTVNFENYG